MVFVFYTKKILRFVRKATIATSKAAEAVARQPEAESKITKILLLGGALAEATAIYGFVIGILIILFMA